MIKILLAKGRSGLGFNVLPANRCRGQPLPREDSLGELPAEIVTVAQNHHERRVKMVRKELAKLKGPPSHALIMTQIMVALLTDPDQTHCPDSFRI